MKVKRFFCSMLLLYIPPLHYNNTNTLLKKNLFTLNNRLRNTHNGRTTEKGMAELGICKIGVGRDYCTVYDQFRKDEGTWKASSCLLWKRL